MIKNLHPETRKSIESEYNKWLKDYNKKNKCNSNSIPDRIYEKLIAFHITWNGREKLENDEEALKDKEYNSIL